MSDITPPAGETLPATRVEFARRVARALLVVLGILVAGGAVTLIALNEQLGELLFKVQRKLDPPDIYTLAAHAQAGKIALEGIHAAPSDPAAWMRVARFELADNNPIGAAWTLGEAKALGAPAEKVAALEGEIAIARKRWDALYGQVLIGGRLFDGNNRYEDVYRLLDAWRDTGSTMPLHGKARADYDLLKAHLLLREGRREEARHLLEELRKQPWALQGLCNYLYAKTLRRENDLAPAIEAFGAYLRDYPGERLNRYALMELGAAALASGDEAGARAAFTQLIELDPTHLKAAEARLALLDLDAGVILGPSRSVGLSSQQVDLLSLGSEEATAEASEPKGGASPADGPPSEPPVPSASTEPMSIPAETFPVALIPGSAAMWDRYGTVFHSGPEASALVDRAIALFVECAEEGSPHATALASLTGPAALGWAEALAAAGRPQAALKIARRGLNGACDGPTRVALAQLHGRLRLTLGEAKVAEKGMLEDRKQVPAGTDLGLLDYELARAYRRQGLNYKAREWYLKASGSADAELAADARSQAAWAATQMGRWEDALADYRWLVEKHPDSVYSEIARDHLLTDAFAKGRSDEARTLAAQLERATRGQRAAKGQYFRMRLAGADHDDWEALYRARPFSIYGVYAAERVDEKHADYALDERVSLEAYEAWRAFATSPGGACFFGGLWDLAEAEWEFAGEEPPTPYVALGGVLLEVAQGDHIRTILDSQDFLDHGWQAAAPPDLTLALLDAAYPLDYLDQIEAPAAKYGVTAPEVLGIIRQETYFNPRAVSTAGARGLMQLMPATATWAAKQVGLAKPSPEDLFDPAVNLPLAIWHIWFLEQELGEGFGLVLAAHNGGIGNVRKWQERFPLWQADSELFTELIPNRETRDFVKVVRANQAVYEYRLAHLDHSVPF